MEIWGERNVVVGGTRALEGGWRFWNGRKCAHSRGAHSGGGSESAEDPLGCGVQRDLFFAKDLPGLWNPQVGGAF